jgi:hypothetical protein
MQVSIINESLKISMNTISEEGDAFVLVKYGEVSKGVEVSLFKDAKSGMWGASVGGVYGLEYASTPELAWKDALRQYAEINILEGMRTRRTMSGSLRMTTRRSGSWRVAC